MPRRESPLPRTGTPLSEFAIGLRELRREAGSPSYRALAKLAHYSPSTLSDAAGGQRLPSLEVTQAFVRACGGDVPEWTGRWHALAAARQTPGPVTAPEEGEAPYVGLAMFDTRDAERFFGRERLTEELADRVARRRFVVLLGASGAGKSSLLRAGLLPRLSEPVVLLRPGARPLEECAIRLAHRLARAATAVLAELRADHRALHWLLRQVAEQARPDGEVVLVVDQFEEVFTLCPDERERAAFIAALCAAARADNSRTRVVLGVRADFYAQCMRYPELIETWQDAQVHVGPMTAEQLRAAITRPAAAAGCTVEQDLVATLIAQTTGQPGVLPLLSHVLLEVWRRRRGNALTLAGYQAAGGVDGALARSAESCFDGLTAAEQHAAKHLILRLAALGEGTEDTRRRMGQEELSALDAVSASVLERLAAARLVTVTDTGAELAHEALIRAWPRLRRWLVDDRDGLRVHRGLTEATRVWLEHDRDPGVLYRGARLTAAEEWLAGGTAVLTPDERAFLRSSSAARLAEEAGIRRRGRRRRMLIALLTVLLLVACTSTALLLRTRERLTAQRNELLVAKVAEAAVAMRRDNPALAAQLSLAVSRLLPSPVTRDSLPSTLATPLTGHTGVLMTTVFHPGGQLLASAGVDRTIQFWDLSRPRSPQRLGSVPSGHTDYVLAAKFSPDGRILATSGADDQVRLREVADPARPGEPRVLTGHTDLVYDVDFSPSGGLLATSSHDRTVRLWDLRRPETPPVVFRHDQAVRTVDFSPDGRFLATGSDDRTVRLWDIANPARPLATLAGHTGFINAADFSADSRFLATGATDHSVRLWDLGDPAQPRELATITGHTDVVSALDFHPTKPLLATSGLDRTVRLWDLANPRAPVATATLTGHRSSVHAVEFSPDGQRIITGSEDLTAQLWELDAAELTALACARARPPITEAEWQEYLPGLPYQPPCP